MKESIWKDKWTENTMVLKLWHKFYSSHDNENIEDQEMENNVKKCKEIDEDDHINDYDESDGHN